MPTFKDLTDIPSREDALNAIITSIAMEETALSHVITAESEKIKYIVDCAKAKGCDVIETEKLLAVNKSAGEVLNNIVNLQKILKEKLKIATSFLPSPYPPCRCVSRFKTAPGYVWCGGLTLDLIHLENCDGVKQKRCGCESLIQLPPGKKFEIFFEIEAINKSCQLAKIELEFRCGKKLIKKETITQQHAEKDVTECLTTTWKTPADCTKNYIVLKLIMPEHLSCVVASLNIKLVDDSRAYCTH